MRTGRPPVADSERRNKTKPTYDWVRLPRQLPEGWKVPTLPKAPRLTPATRKWWKEIWQSPMAVMWHDTDVYSLIELAVLRDKLLEGTHQVASEVRMREADYGLTLAGRKGLRWVIEGEEEQVPEAPAKLPDVRRLKVVGD